MNVFAVLHCLGRWLDDCEVACPPHKPKVVCSILAGNDIVSGCKNPYAVSLVIHAHIECTLLRYLYPNDVVAYVKRYLLHRKLRKQHSKEQW
ncbi:hypothetical protein TNCV_3450331 [Trichonephila clavipes]|uniref:Uncharacterized protein n=1 Tax=Trichonephila clavipes TaxID=2585209 RepID=A0A8X7BM61_TRICX|nr:hypothetical protein TNCV_3450331 [Trichonephila clavipes]